MGLIKATAGAIGGTLSDQWREFFYCDALDKDVLMTRGKKQTSSRYSNIRGHDNIISNGSGISVADGQCMMIVEQGKIVEVCAEPGEYTYDSSSEPSIFYGPLGKSILDTFRIIGKRFTYGGDTAKDQRVYYFNTKELIDNKFGTPNPIMFRIVDSKINLDMDVSIRCSGVYSFKIIDPLIFYTNVCGNVTDEYKREEIESQLKTEFIDALQPALSKLSDLELRPNQVVSHTTELGNALNETLSSKWREGRGLKVVSVAISSLTLSEEDAELIKQAQLLKDTTMATLVSAQADSMRAAAKNEGGAMAGFMGMGLAGTAGASSILSVRAQQQQQQSGPQQTAPQQQADDWTCKCGVIAAGKFCPECGTQKPTMQGRWTCKCGSVATGKFCPECGSPKPQDDGWVCKCRTVNKGRFCQNCGEKKPEGTPLYRCDKCGFEPADPTNPGKFCPECGDPFTDDDVK